LVHDAAVGADEFILRALAEAGQLGAWIAAMPMSDSTATAVATSTEAELERPEASGTSPQRLRLKAGNGVPGLRQQSPCDAEGVVGPVATGRGGQRRGVKDAFLGIGCAE
jgi:hypothetical protein